MTDLVLVKGAGVLDLLKDSLNAPTQAIEFKNSLGWQGEVIGDEDMEGLIIVLGIATQEDEDLEGRRAVPNLGLKGVGQEGAVLAMSIVEVKELGTSHKKRLDEFHELIGTHPGFLFGQGMFNKKTAIGFNFSK